MTAANISSSLPAVKEDLQQDHLIQPLDALSTSTSPPAIRSAKTELTPPTDTAGSDASQFAIPAIHTQHPWRQTESFLEDGETMGEANTLARQLSNTSDDSITSRRPSTPRSQTDPSPEAMSTYYPQPRNRSPYSRSHLRSQSGSSSPNAPPMTRAHSLPTVMHPTGRLSLSPSPMPLAQPSSPLCSPKRNRSPRGLEARPLATSAHERYGAGIRPVSAGSFGGSPSVCDISEDAELELTPRAGTGVSNLYSSTGSLSRRRRPASPLYQVSATFGAQTNSISTGSTPTSTASSPLLAPSKFNEQYPASLTSSSVSSTPTSMRSRSPSISSLETIEDSPDAEEEAIEEDRIAKLRAAADREDGGDQRRSSLDVPEGRGRSMGFGKRDSRKRWSVCGAERRQDLDLETIWED